MTLLVARLIIVEPVGEVESTELVTARDKSSRTLSRTVLFPAVFEAHVSRNEWER